MADRRMLTKKVTDDDNFLGLSSSAQALYLHLSMSADDDGFCNQVSTAMFRSHASVQDLEALLEKRFIYQFENGVIVIKHWRMANALRKDRYKPTAFQEELSKLGIKENGAYTWLPDGCQLVATDKDSIDKDSINRCITSQDLSDYEIPSFDLDSAFKQMFEEYPKKKNYQSCRCAYLDIFKGVFRDNYEQVAHNVREAMFLYAQDYKEHNPSDKTFRFIPTLDTWLKEDALYWMNKVELDDD